MHLRLSPQPDAMGFYYGDVCVSDAHYRVNVLPPLSERTHWMGKMRSVGIVPDAKLWIVFIDGEEVSRVPTRGDIDEVIASACTTGA